MRGQGVARGVTAFVSAELASCMVGSMGAMLWGQEGDADRLRLMITRTHLYYNSKLC